MKVKLLVLAATFVVGAAICGSTFAGDGGKGPGMQCCPMDPKAAAALDKLKAMNGSWTYKSGGDMPAGSTGSIVFHPTSNGTAVLETMFPGSEHEMVNVFTADGDSILMTHFCGMGNQPRMKLKPAANADDAKTMSFEFVDGGNIKSRNEPHMDSVALTVDGDKLTEDWSFYNDGKVVSHSKFEFERAAK